MATSLSLMTAYATAVVLVLAAATAYEAAIAGAATVVVLPRSVLEVHDALAHGLA